MTAPEKSTPPQKSKFKRLTAAQKAEAIALWKSGNVTLATLSQKFGKSEETFSRLFAAGNIKKGENAERQSKKVEEKVESEIVDDAAELARRIREVKDEHFKMASGIRKLVQNEIVQARARGDQLFTITGNLKALEKAAQTLRIVREEAYVVLGIANGEETDPDDIPDLTVKELTAEEVHQIQQEQNAAMKAETSLDIEDGDIEVEELIV